MSQNVISKRAKYSKKTAQVTLQSNKSFMSPFKIRLLGQFHRANQFQKAITWTYAFNAHHKITPRGHFYGNYPRLPSKKPA